MRFTGHDMCPEGRKVSCKLQLLMYLWIIRYTHILCLLVDQNLSSLHISKWKTLQAHSLFRLFMKNQYWGEIWLISNLVNIMEELIHIIKTSCTYGHLRFYRIKKCSFVRDIKIIQKQGSPPLFSIQNYDIWSNRKKTKSWRVKIFPLEESKLK